MSVSCNYLIIFGSSIKSMKHHPGLFVLFCGRSIFGKSTSPAIKTPIRPLTIAASYKLSQCYRWGFR